LKAVRAINLHNLFIQQTASKFNELSYIKSLLSDSWKRFIREYWSYIQVG